MPLAARTLYASRYHVRFSNRTYDRHAATLPSPVHRALLFSPEALAPGSSGRSPGGQAASCSHRSTLYLPLYYRSIYLSIPFPLHRPYAYPGVA